MLFIKHALTVVFGWCALVLILLGLFSLSEDVLEREANGEIISAATSFGIETIAHKQFINKLIQDTKLNQKAKIEIFLGPYVSLLGNRGMLISDPPNYYVLIDAYFFFSLTQDEQRALIAHEIGHEVYKINFIDKLQFKIFSRFGIFNGRRNAIFTKYQIKADEFSAEKTSLGITISLLNKLYVSDKDNSDYKMRMESLKRLKQG